MRGALVPAASKRHEAAVRFDPHRRARGVEPPDLTGQVVGLCIVESKAPSVNARQRWRIRCHAMTPERDDCGALLYLETAHIRQYQQPGHELFACKECRARRRAAANLVRFACEGCRAHVEIPKHRQAQRSELTKRLCPHCAIKAGRTHAEGTRMTQRAERRQA